MDCPSNAVNDPWTNSFRTSVIELQYLCLLDANFHCDKSHPQTLIVDQRSSKPKLPNSKVLTPERSTWHSTFWRGRTGSGFRYHESQFGIPVTPRMSSWHRWLELGGKSLYRQCRAFKTQTLVTPPRHFVQDPYQKLAPHNGSTSIVTA